MSETHIRIHIDGRPHDVVLTKNEDGSITVNVDGQDITVTQTGPAPGKRAVAVTIEDRTRIVERLDLERLRVDEAVSTYRIEHVRSGKAGAEVPNTGLDVRPPMPGRIVRLAVEEGDIVEQGQLIGVLEAMKMQNEVTSPAHGTVRRILVGEGDTVDAHQVILQLGPADEQPSEEKKQVVA